MFATDYLKQYEGINDWVCIIDFCGRDMTISDIANVSAYYSPSRKIVALGNDWSGIPDMPCKRKPTESQINRWIDNNYKNCIYEQKRRAAIRRQERRDAQSNKIQAWFKKHGSNYAFAAYQNGDEVKAFVGPIGIRTLFDVLSDFSRNIGYQKIIKFKVGKKTEMDEQLANFNTRLLNN